MKIVQPEVQSESGPIQRNVRIVLAYEGTDFHGSQLQVRERTVQSELEGALKQVTAQMVRVNLAGRTDTGVHAVGQVANFHLLTARPEEFFRQALNAVLPADLRIVSAEFVPDDFHARFAAIRREYCYTLLNGPVLLPAWRRYASHLRRALDLTGMREATLFLEGEHDFASFCGAGQGVPILAREDEGEGADVPPRRNMVRQISLVRWDEELLTAVEGRLLRFTIVANGFLPHMVRNIVGTLSEVGQGKITPLDFAGIIQGADRRLAGPTAPAKGLCLTKVYY